MDDDSFTLLVATLRAVCCALTPVQRQAVADALHVQASELNETAQDEPSQLAALSLSALASVALGDPANAVAVLRAPGQVQGRDAT